MAKVTIRKSVGKASSTTKKLAAKSTIGHWSKSGSSGKSGKFPRLLRIASKKNVKKLGGAYRIVGRTTDGVVILRPKVRSSHFTSKEIRRSISAVRR